MTAASPTRSIDHGKTTRSNFSGRSARKWPRHLAVPQGDRGHHGMVFVMVFVAAIFFFVDRPGLSRGVRWFGLGH